MTECIDLKLSCYNVVVDVAEASVHIWNTRNASIVELTPDEWAELQKGNYSSPIIKEELPALIRNGILVAKDLDEYSSVVFQAKTKQYNPLFDSFGLVIAPTLACNYNCPYCFEKQIESSHYCMSAEVQKLLTEKLDQLFSERKEIENFRITWFGGEPLLAYEKVIVPLQKAVIKICKKHDVTFKANIVTNGYFLTQDKFDFMFGDDIFNLVQITFDGTEKEYCLRKGTGAESYVRVLNNMLSLAEYLKKNNKQAYINLRLNADNSNYEDIKKFVQRVKSDARFNSHIRFTLARLRNYGECECSGSFCTTKDFEKLCSDFEEYIGTAPKLPAPKKTFCGQHCMNVFSVGPHGELYKCEHDFGITTHAVGNLKSGLTYNGYFTEFMEQPLPEKCKTCCILPVCMGGCPHRRLELKQQIECEYTVENMIEKAKKYILRR